jgi:hypothetical protein
MTPLVTIVGRRTPPDPLTGTSVADWIKRLAQAVGTNPFYLDIARLRATHRVAGKKGEKPVLAAIYTEARKRNMRFIPVIRVGESSKSHIELVSDAALEDGLGVAFRYCLRRFVPPAGMTRQTFLESQIVAARTTTEESDLIVDLEYLDEDDEINPDDIAAALADMCAAGTWRSLVLIGTSIPTMMSCVPEGTVGSIPRREWNLWIELQKRDLTRVPAFGDYAIQHPHPPQDASGGNTMRANVRYTIADETLVARGRGPVTQQGNEQYQDLCEQLVARSEFSGSEYSWGDAVIEKCASGRQEPGSQSTWRGAGTSHHVQLITDRLRELEALSQSDA